jgi:hypothetical protein
MKYSFLLAIIALLLFKFQKVNAQVKTDTIYYLLDTAQVPVKDRMFRIEIENPFMFYTLECKCFPYGYGIGFYYPIANKKEYKISVQEFRQFKTASVTQLIDFAIKSLLPENKSKYQFIIAEPEGNKIKLTDMKVWIPMKPRKTTAITTSEPMKN